MCSLALARKWQNADKQQSPLTESNCRPFPYHGNALPTELRGRILSVVSLTFRYGPLR